MTEWVFDFDRAVSLATMLFTAVAAVAAVKAAVAAVKALSAWRSQVQGQTQHDLAKRLAGAMYQLGKARNQARVDLAQLERGLPLDKAVVPAHAIANALSLDALHTNTEQLEIDARIVWGREVASVISALRQGANHIGQYVNATAQGDVFARISYCNLDGVSYLGEAFPQRMQQLDELLQDWLGQHVGRVGAETMSVQQLVQRQRNIDDAAARIHSREWNEHEAEAAENTDEAETTYAEHCAMEQAERERFDEIALPSPDPVGLSQPGSDTRPSA